LEEVVMTIPGGTGTEYDATGGQTPGGGYTEPSYTTPVSTYSPSAAYEPPQPAAPGSLTFLLVIVGIVLVLVGMILQISLVKVEDNDAAENIILTAGILASIGAAILSIGLFYGALRDTGLGDYVRVGLAIAAGLVAGFWASGAGSIFSLLAFL
jgi:hypothetical protein